MSPRGLQVPHQMSLVKASRGAVPAHQAASVHLLCCQRRLQLGDSKVCELDTAVLTCRFWPLSRPKMRATDRLSTAPAPTQHF